MNATILLYPLARARAAAKSRLEGDEYLSLQFLVETRNALRVRRAIVSMLNAEIGIMSVAPVPRDTRVRFTLRLKRGAKDELLDALMKAVESGELGAIRPVRTVARVIACTARAVRIK